MLTIEDIDLRRIIDLIQRKHGYDFRNYAMSSFRRRVLRMLELKHLTVDSLVLKLTDHPAFVNEFLNELTVNVTEMFRDHGFWLTLKKEIIPGIIALRRPFKIWHAGCSSGEEVFSMAILLKEMHLSNEATIFASDLDLKILDKAMIGSYPFKNMEVNESNYTRFQGAGGSLKKYYTLQNGHAAFDKDLLKNVTFLKHDLVTGPAFDQFDLILCRNVMIYFNQSLQNDVLNKFHKSLVTQGYLAIGSKESLIWCDISNKFSVVSNEEKIYRKIKD